jgi:hypothetical protein
LGYPFEFQKVLIHAFDDRIKNSSFPPEDKIMEELEKQGKYEIIDETSRRTSLIFCSGHMTGGGA